MITLTELIQFTSLLISVAGLFYLIGKDNHGKKITATVLRKLGGYFVCLVIALRTYGITKSKASNTQADDGYKKIRRKHTQALH